MKKRYFIPTIVATLLCSGLSASAVKARPGLVDKEMPDGSSIKVLIHGDERGHYLTSEDGYLLLPDDKGFYYFAVPDVNGSAVASRMRATERGQRSLEVQSMLEGIDSTNLIERYKAASSSGARYTFSTAAFPTIGDAHSLVVLVEYQDVKFSMKDAHDYFSRFLNSENFTDNGGTGSCRQYFIDNSNGLFSPTFDLYGPVPLANNRKYYGENDRYGEDRRAAQMVVEAVKYLDESVDFSQYDLNGDGYVDNIYIIYAGAGEASGGPDDSVWPYSYDLESENIDLRADGVKFNSYGVSNELYRGVPDGIGTYVHEFCHVLGLPDLYNTERNDASTPLDWSLMDQGSYNNEACTPPYLSSFERYSLGWMDCDEILASGDYSLPALGASNKAYILTTEENKDEFFLLENRQLEGWDAYLPNHGMLIWHIDFVQSEWDYNTVNNKSTHQYVCLLRADNKATEGTLRGDTYPGTSRNTEFDTTTKPSLLSWKNKKLNVTSIGNIAENDGLISFSAVATEDRSSSVGEIVDVNENGIVVRGSVIINSGNPCTIYDITGKIIGQLASGESLQVDRGLYIVSGKKYFVTK